MGDKLFHIKNIRMNLKPISLAKSLRLHAHLLQQLARRVCVHLFHHRQQHSPGGFGIGLGVVVVKLVADMRRQGGELMIWQFRPDAPGKLAGANIIKLRPGQAEMIQGFAQMSDVEGGVMRNHKVGAGQPGQKFRRNGGKFRGIQNIQMRQAVNFNEIFVETSRGLWVAAPANKAIRSVCHPQRRPARRRKCSRASDWPFQNRG